MKVKTSITLSEELMQAIEIDGDGLTRSEFIEKALWSYIRQQRRIAIDERDAQIIDRIADELNARVADVLEYQADPFAYDPVPVANETW